MKLNIPVDSIEAKYLTPDVRNKINGSEQIINNYVTNTQITNINGVIKAKCISLTNISLNNTTTILDGYTLVNNDIILVAGQTDKTENGLYRYDTTFVRYNFEAGDLIAILNGTNYANSLWKNSNNEIVVGTTLIDFEPMDVEGLPAGADGNIAVNEGGVWAAKGKLAILLNASELRYIFSSPSTMSTRRTAIIVTKDSYGSQLLLNTGSYPNAQLYGVSNYNGLFLAQDANSYLQIASHSITNIFEWKLSSVMQFSIKRNNGTIFSNSLTANTFLAANANKEIVSRNPNTIVTTTADLTVLTGTASWVDIPLLTVMLEPSVTYELQIMLAISGAQGRDFKLRLNTASATYVYRPFVKNTSGVGTDVVYAVDGSSAIPQILDNETEINLTTGNTYHYVEMKGILTTTNNIPTAKLQIYNDSLFDIVVKGYSYMKLTR